MSEKCLSNACAVDRQTSKYAWIQPWSLGKWGAIGNSLLATSEPKLGGVFLRVPRCQLDRQHLDSTKPITRVLTPDSVGVWLLNRPISLSNAEHALNILQRQNSLASAHKLGSSGLELGACLGVFY